MTREEKAIRLRPQMRAAVDRLSLRKVAEGTGISHAALHNFLDKEEVPYERTLRKMEKWLSGAGVQSEQPAASNGGPPTAEAVREELATAKGAAGHGRTSEPPSLAQLDWMPKLFELVLRDPKLSANEKAALMGEINAGGMRYWAVAAEWAGGQRGIAMQRAEVSSDNRGRWLRPEEPESGIKNMPPNIPLPEDDGPEEEKAGERVA